jgi:2-(3-amino-3-carboxypropyl)histidine synthase
MIRMEKIINELKNLKARKIFIQFPEGLKLRIQDISRELEKNGFDIVLCLEECFGACDVRDYEARLLGCDVIVHIGHEKFISKTSLPVVYWEYFLDVDPIPILKKELNKLKNYKKIGLITSIQFVKTIPKVKKYLEEKGKEVYAYKALQYPGQVLGCNLEAAKEIEKKVECFLCISAGKFYASGIVMITKKPVLNLDLEKKEIGSLEEFKKKVQKIITWNKAQLKDAKKVGVLVSWKKGQLANPSKIKNDLENRGKEVYILAMDKVTPEKLEGLKLDVLVNCACPRIGIDDIGKYRIPILNADELG